MDFLFVFQRRKNCFQIHLKVWIFAFYKNGIRIARTTDHLLWFHLSHFNFTCCLGENDVKIEMWETPNDDKLWIQVTWFMIVKAFAHSPFWLLILVNKDSYMYMDNLIFIVLGPAGKERKYVRREKIEEVKINLYENRHVYNDTHRCSTAQKSLKRAQK